ncbi:MAG: penicillin-binding protein 2 [Deltaproteobacteria bacterium]|nr:penicillin-binding protein 2 [Deltaproteobacteria bacterium]
MNIGSSQQGGRAYGNRLLTAGGVAALFFFVLLGRLYVLQIARGEEFAEKSQENFIKELRVPATRGMIFDRHGRALVDERPSYDIFLTPAFCKSCDETITRLADTLSLDSDAVTHIKDQVKKSHGLVRFRAFPVKIDVPRDDLDKLNAVFIDLQGVDILPTPHRNYRYGMLAAQVLGYMNEIRPEELEELPANGPHYEQGDFIGRTGIERQYEKELKGKDGIERVVVDAKGNQSADKSDLIKDEQRLVPAIPGHNLVLSIDEKLQAAAEKIFPGKAGVVIVLDVNTGDVLALVSRPGFDPNKMSGRISRQELQALSEDPFKPLRFRATQDHYNPGSTFKIVTGLAALESGALKDGGTIFCNGGYTLGRRRWRCDKESGHGSLDLTHAIGASCDTFFYALADRMGIEPIAAMSHDLGLGSPTGIDLGYEDPGVVPSKAWHDAHTPGGYQKGFALNTAIGQGDNLVTPMQLAVLYAAIANGGTVYKPHLLRRVEDSEGHLIREVQPEVERKLPVKPEHLAAIVEGLKAVVNEPGGTAYGARLKDFPIMVAGKTGTAQVANMTGARVKEKDLDYWHKSNSWFASFAPADKPEIAVVVLNEHGGFGASAAAPTAMAVTKAYFDLKNEYQAESEGQPLTVPPPQAKTAPPPEPPREKPPRIDTGNTGPALAASESDAAPEPDAAPPEHKGKSKTAVQPSDVDASPVPELEQEPIAPKESAPAKPKADPKPSAESEKSDDDSDSDSDDASPQPPAPNPQALPAEQKPE